MKIKNKVYITTTSSISCAGNNNDELFKNICENNTGIKKDTTYFPMNEIAIGKISSTNSFYEELLIQCTNILKNSNINNFQETLLIIGSSVGGMSNTEHAFFTTKDYKEIDVTTHNIHSISLFLNDSFKFYDDISFSTACTSSANAIGYAYEVLSKGIYKNVLVIGLDSLCKTTVGGFKSLGILSNECCQPFDKNRKGMNVSEAIACLLLQTEKNKNCIEVCGVGYSSDAYHITQPHQDGSKNAMLNALNNSKLNHTQIDYINAHGTGTQVNDTSEANAIFNIFSNKPYISSTKSITGHTLGAAGALEAIISCMVIQKQIIPSNSFLNKIENTSINLTLKNIEQEVNYVLSNSFAFGGNNCSLIFGSTK